MTVRGKVSPLARRSGRYLPHAYPPRPSMRLNADICAYCRQHSHWHAIPLSGYYVREVGTTAMQNAALITGSAIA